MAYEEMKSILLGRKGRSESGHLPVHEYIAMAALSKVFATTVTYPYQVVRSRLQEQRGGAGEGRYKGAIDCVRKISLREGFRGFYKGLVPSLVRVLPSTCVVFSTYEFVAGCLRVNGQ